MSLDPKYPVDEAEEEEGYIPDEWDGVEEDPEVFPLMA